MKFGDEIQPTAKYADSKKRKFIFMSWMGGDLKDYARVATIQENGEGFDEQGEWKKDIGLVLKEDSFIHKNNIKPL